MKDSAAAARSRATPWRRPATVDASVAAAGLAALVAWDATGMDITVARWLGGPGGFPWQHHWLTAGLLHGGTRYLAWGLLAAFVVGVWRPWGPLRSLTKSQRVWMLATTAACAALIPLIKRLSTTSCPWSLAEFGGGVAQYVPHWMPGVTDGGPGGCFPSGHASTAFAFLAAWFVLREGAPSAARRWLLLTVIAGLVLGAVQVVRGAHYPSHPLWTAWICWVVSALSFHILGPRARMPS
ncbi:MAG TPA: phosphatase PAP2 family protein [Burkholderiaceae bacterium]|nr:phosphatase PAP2 family protein [Burkholderiaceae bacterium]